MYELSDLIEARLLELPEGLRDHIQRTREVARELALRHGVDVTTADVGAAAHDLARALPRRDLLAEADRLRLDLGLVERHEPILLHGPVAARWIGSSCGHIDPTIVESVRWHTTGRPGMSDVAKVVFLADKLDPHKVRRFPFLERVASEARHSMDAAILEYLNRTIEYIMSRNRLVHTASLELRNELIVRLKAD